jgi:hypothetical protein
MYDIVGADSMDRLEAWSREENVNSSIETALTVTPFRFAWTTEQ